jgi:hypothetical protein
MIERSTKDEDSDSSDDSGEEGVPGPGYYLHNNSFSGFTKKNVPTRLQFFGSMEERFRSES